MKQKKRHKSRGDRDGHPIKYFYQCKQRRTARNAHKTGGMLLGPIFNEENSILNKASDIQNKQKNSQNLAKMTAFLCIKHQKWSE
jgi:hypothetical protein